MSSSGVNSLGSDPPNNSPAWLGNQRGRRGLALDLLSAARDGEARAWPGRQAEGA